MKKKKKAFTIVLVILILMSIFYGGYYYIKNKGYSELSKNASYNYRLSIFYSDQNKTVVYNGKYKNQTNEITLQNNEIIKLNINKEIIENLKDYAILPNMRGEFKIDIKLIKEKDEVLNSIIDTNDELTCKYFIKKYNLEDVICNNIDNNINLDFQFKK